jgi:acyl-CoA synthetase (AMP-forming)/AMP-acid ligase II
MTADTDLSSLRAVVYGGGPITEAGLENALKVWGDVLYQMYAQSEGGPLTVLMPSDHGLGGPPEQRRRMRSAGRPAPTCELRIVDADDGTALAIGEIGEIAVKTPTSMSAIWGNAESTAERMLPDGYLLTRDMGYVDEDGYLFLVDRKEDMIISGGFNIWPVELEDALSSHPAVAEAVVVGIRHEKWGETPKAVVVLAAGQTATEAELIDWTRRKVGAVKRVTSVDFVDELPRSPLGKVLRRVVRDRCGEVSSTATES